MTFDPETDVAVLRVDQLDEAPLALDTDGLSRGSGGVVLGYPGGGNLTIGPAAVLQSYEARGRDIYNHNLTTRAHLRAPGACAARAARAGRS